MKNFYSDERNIQILIYLLKAHGIKKVIASPGTANISFIGSIMNDPWFEIYSSVDERSAAYIACGLAEESGQPVILTCTGATASRNYIPGMTEAYYRKLPILAITSTKDVSNIGHLIAQVIDRSQQIKDTYIHSVHINTITDKTSEWDANVKINRAILELKHRGGGPVHINLTSSYKHTFSTKSLPIERVIHRIEASDKFPNIPNGKIGIFIGSHKKFTEPTSIAIDEFCRKYNAAVFCDHTSGYYGKFKTLPSLIKAQTNADTTIIDVDLLIHIGEVSGDYYGMEIKGQQVWRINPDGEIRDLWHKLTHVFEMSEEKFFNFYVTKNNSNISHSDNYYSSICELYSQIKDNIPELPLSNTWIAQQTAHRLPKHSFIHFGILNSLRNWNFFYLPETVESTCNTGGFGIDGSISTLLGASLSNPDKLHFIILGDLAFFYDLNTLGNRHMHPNIRIMLINNGKGTEFRNYNNPARVFGDEADTYIAAAGHYGNKSNTLVRHYAEDLGFEYITASTKEDYLKNLNNFISPNLANKPILFEIFTNSNDESDALKLISNTLINTKYVIKNNIIKMTRSIAGERGINKIKEILSKN